ncbi:MAG: thioesterase domain-containing protein [Snowella sp.]|nr:thioesterase domain-containing protein [Snowella sp.]
MHFQEPNPAIPFAKLGLKVQENLEFLPKELEPIRAGVSTFGLGGTNAHVLLESVPSKLKAEPNLLPLQIFTLSAKSPTALQTLVQRYHTFLEDQPEASLMDICFTANTRRSQFQQRLAIITESKQQLKDQLNLYINKQLSPDIFSGQITRRKPAPVCFIFSGESDKIKPLIKLLYQSQRDFNSLLEPLELILNSHVGKSFLELIEEENLESPLSSQLVDFLCEYAIAQCWRSWGIEPAIAIGYGTGNYATLVLAEILTLKNIISLILKKEDLTSIQNFQPVKIPIVSSVTSNTIQTNQIIDFEQWQKEFNFTKNNLKNLPNSLLNSSQILLDICSIQIKNPDIETIDNYNINGDNLTSLFSTLIKFWLIGIKIDWSKVEDYKQCDLISLPTYPFERQSYWINISNQNKNHIANNQNKLEQLDQEFVAPRDELEFQLTKIWEKVIRSKPIGVRDSFFDLGGNSLAAIKLLAQIEKIFQTNMPISVIFQAPTIEQLAKILRQEKNISSLYSLVPIQPKGSRSVLFVIHWLNYARDLSRHLGEDQPIYGLYFGMGETMKTSKELAIEDLAKHYIQEMRILQPEGPYFLIGHSFGGLVAYEMAQQLVAEGQQVALLALVDSYIEDKGQKTASLPQIISNLWRMGFSEFLKRVKLKVVGKYINVKSFFSPHIHTTVPVELFIKAYNPKPYSGECILFKAMNCAILYDVNSPEPGWRKYINGDLIVHEIPGGHSSILQEPHVKLLADKLTLHLEKSLPD